MIGIFSTPGAGNLHGTIRFICVSVSAFVFIPCFCLNGRVKLSIFTCEIVTTHKTVLLNQLFIFLILKKRTKNQKQSEIIDCERLKIVIPDIYYGSRETLSHYVHK